MANTTVSRPGLFARGRGAGRQLSLGQQLLLQLFCLIVAFSVLFPIVWIVSMSFEGSAISRPTKLRLFPAEPSVTAYREVLDKPTSNPVTFTTLVRNSFSLAAGVSFLSVMIGVTAAYALSRFNFTGRQLFFIGIGFILLMPQIATLAPLFTLLSKFQVSQTTLMFGYIIFGALMCIIGASILIGRIRNEELHLPAAVISIVLLLLGGIAIYNGIGLETGESIRPFNLRSSLYGVGFAMISGALPFAIWNLKGYLDTIPKELEEAAIIDGATPNQIFFRIVLPLATPALAVTAFLGFMSGWTEYALSWLFLSKPENYTLAMTLGTMTGQYASEVPWSRFAAMSLMISLPVSIVYLFLQKYIVGGLTLGGVKG